MSYGLTECSRTRICPICGHTNWCCFMPNNDGDGDVVICKRTVEQSDVVGKDGNLYVYVAESRSGNAVFELQEQYERRHKNYKSRQKGEFHPQQKKREFVYVDNVEELPHETLDKIYREILKRFPLRKEELDWLHKKGYSDHVIKNNMLAYLPPSDYFRWKNRDSFKCYSPYRKTVGNEVAKLFGGSLEGVPGAYMDDKGNWTFAGKDGIMLPIYDADGFIYRIKIRLSNPPEHGGKCRNFTSFAEDEEKKKEGIIKNIYNKGCAANNNIGIYIPKNCKDYSMAFVTEGEGKSMIASDIMNIIFVSIPGVDSYNKLIEKNANDVSVMDQLKSLGVEMLITALDADKAFNENVMNAERKTIDVLQKEGFDLAVSEWNVSLGKGIDDLLVNGYSPDYMFYY